jgi:hypothetical protein
MKRTIARLSATRKKRKQKELHQFFHHFSQYNVIVHIEKTVEMLANWFSTTYICARL